LRLREPAVRAPNRNVQNQVELLIEGRCIRTIRPGVRQWRYARPIVDSGRELAALEERLVEAKIEKSMQARVDVNAPESDKR
jgi:hypothetical protein